jgi:vitamin B12 transporter
MTRVIGVLTFVLAGLAAADVAAQDTVQVTQGDTPVKVEEPVVVTATKTPTPVSQTGASVTVVEGEAIQQRQATDIIQILRDQPGFSVIQSGGRGTATSIFTRGGNNDMNLVLIDGMKVNQGGGVFDFGNVTSAGIGRVEIVRGPQSALHGADAMTSVIHFFTPRGEGPFSAWGFAGGGNYDTHEERVGLSWGNRLGGIFAEFLNVETSGILDVNNDYRNRTGAIRLDLSPTPDLDFTVTGRYTDSDVGVPTEGAGDRFEQLDPRQFQEDRRFVGTFKTRFRHTPWLEHRVLFGANLTTNDFVDPADPIPTDFPPDSRTLSKERRLLADYNMLLSPPAFWQITPTVVLGAGYEHQNFTQESTFSAPVDVDRETVSAYGQVQLNWRDHVFLTAGGRYDDSTAFGTEFTPRVALAVVAPVTRTRVRGAWGTGIKEPAFFAEFGGFGVPGNPDIEAEKSRSWEVGVDQPLFGRLVEVGVTYFENRFEDLIAFVSFLEGSRNIQAAKTRGVEVVVTFGPFKGWTASGTYTFLDTEVTDDGGIADAQNVFPEGQPLLRRPRHSGSVAVGYSGDRLTAALSLFVKGDSLDRDFSQSGPPLFAPAPRVTLPGYQKLDLSFAYTLFKDVLGLREITWKTRLQNVLNQDYEEIFGFSAPRITALTGLEVRY